MIISKSTYIYVTLSQFAVTRVFQGGDEGMYKKMAEKYKVDAVPTFLFLRSNENGPAENPLEEIHRFVGFKNVQEFVSIIRTVLDRS